jgi:BirA family biotin operon repressor/biotin-[acetyl-CoA-carboxylase] ligase
LDVSPIVWHVEHFDEIDSTNTYLSNQVALGVGEGLVALADYQNAGRGRLNRQWESPPRASMLCSVLLRPSIDSNHLQLVVACVALSARAALVRLSGVRPDLKWPNDLVVGDKKLAGILAEIVVTDTGFAVVVGLGINLTYHGPDGIAATSVLDESGLTIAPRALLDIVLEEIESRRELLDSEGGQKTLRDEYERALVTIGQRVRIEQQNDVVEGVATGIDAEGRILVIIDGVVTAFGVGDIVHLRKSESPSP